MCEDGAARRHLARESSRASQLERRGSVGHTGSVFVFLMSFGQLLTMFLRASQCVTYVQHASVTVVERSA